MEGCCPATYLFFVSLNCEHRATQQSIHVQAQVHAKVVQVLAKVVSTSNVCKWKPCKITGHLDTQNCGRESHDIISDNQMLEYMTQQIPAAHSYKATNTCKLDPQTLHDNAARHGASDTSRSISFMKRALLVTWPHKFLNARRAGFKSSWGLFKPSSAEMFT